MPTCSAHETVRYTVALSVGRGGGVGGKVKGTVDEEEVVHVVVVVVLVVVVVVEVVEVEVEAVGVDSPVWAQAAVDAPVVATLPPSDSALSVSLSLINGLFPSQIA